MQQLGHEVLHLTPYGGARITEGDFTRLSDGRILFAYSNFYGNSNDDGGESRLDGILSADEGETWSPPFTLITPIDGGKNVMSVSFLPMSDGALGLFYLRKTGGSCVPFLRRSYDDAQTWSEPLRCVDADGYFVLNNSRVIRTRTGRILLPLASHPLRGMPAAPGVIFFAYSDDDGRTWARTAQISMRERDSVGFEEPGLFEMDDRLWCYIRTDRMCQYAMYSFDDGMRWTEAEGDLRFSSPQSPMTVRQIGDGSVVAVFNPTPMYAHREYKENTWGRTPLMCARSVDGGRTFRPLGLLEADPDFGYCYPAVFPTKEGFLVSYCSGRGGAIPLYATTIKKVGLKP